MSILFLSLLLWRLLASTTGNTSCGVEGQDYFPNISGNALQVDYINQNSKSFSFEGRNTLFLYSSTFNTNIEICQNYSFIVRFCVMIRKRAFNRTVLIREALLSESDDSFVATDVKRTEVLFAAKELCIQSPLSPDFWLCCNNFTIGYDDWIVNSDVIYGISIAGQVVTINSSDGYDLDLERCRNINFNKNSAIGFSQCENSSLPVIRFQQVYIEADNNADLGGILGGTLTAVAVIIVVVAVLLFVICYMKTKKISRQNLQGQNNLYLSSNAEYAEIGPSVPYKLSGYSIKMEYMYAAQGADTGYEKYELDDEDPYVVPPFKEESLYEHIKSGKIKYLPRESIKLRDLLGSGQFGEVFEGILSDSDGSKDVAVKTLKEGTQGKDRIRFLQEVFIMAQFKDPNVVTMYGSVTDGEPVMLVLELLPGGDLRNHLWKMTSTDTNSITLDDHTLLSYCRQVVSGMVYLSAKHFVHRDLAARNILLSVDGICKIADFGMSRDLLYESYYVSHGGLIPVKWTAPEALHYKKYSTASDVWSYGCVMYEIWSVGGKPFENLPNNKVMSLLESGYRLPPPPGCPRMIYKIMIDCWHSEPSQRPSFIDLRGTLSLPDSRLLKWNAEGAAILSEATLLGAALSNGNKLYEDLQTTYKKV